MSFDVGDLWVPELTVRDAETGDLTAATVALSVTSPSGTVSAPTVVPGSIGVYTADVLLTEAGRWVATWTVSGAVTGVESQNVYVRRLGSNVISLSDVKNRLDETVTVDDPEIESIIDAALAEYEDVVGPVSGSHTEIVDGGRASVILNYPNVTAITAAAYSDGTVIDLDDLVLDTRTGIVHWGYNTAGWFTWGTRNVSITYTVGALPANHRETIIADVAGYFAATQRGSADLTGQGFEGSFNSSPLVLFPRIRALAVPSIA